MRTPRAGDVFTFGEGVGLGDGVAFGVGDAVGEALDPGDSCAIATETNAKPVKIVALTFFVIVAARCERRIISATVIDAATVVAPIHIREKVVAPFAVAQKFFIDVVRRKLIVQSIETNKVIYGSLRGVLLCRSCFHQKRPVAGLGEQKFARELFENAIGERHRIVCVCPRDFSHATGGDVQVRINP